ncbi:hypothetical protein KIW84_050900 [Lathyrus oleraceus]|uniref:Reverse transcriptase domain-containing protein n=1 Tax=Pisum sativum TaxID=3888 RepID=A0A9D5AD39_PEA|nr:hypothetical protein KIW84_050900 [Pisum sativum]
MVSPRPNEETSSEGDTVASQTTDVGSIVIPAISTMYSEPILTPHQPQTPMPTTTRTFRQYMPSFTVPMHRMLGMPIEFMESMHNLSSTFGEISSSPFPCYQGLEPLASQFGRPPVNTDRVLNLDPDHIFIWDAEEEMEPDMAYLDENKRESALERERLQNLALKAKEIEDGRRDQTTASKSRRLDCIYDNEPLGFEKNPLNELHKMQAQDPLKEIDLGDGVTRRPTYIETVLPGTMTKCLEHRLPIQPGKRPVKQHPRRFAPKITLKIKQEVERLLKCRFIRTARVYIDDIVIKSSSQNDHLHHLQRSFHGTQERHRDQSKQDKRDFGSQASVDKEIAPVFVREDKLLEKVHTESKWQDEGFFTTPQDQEGE